MKGSLPRRVLRFIREQNLIERPAPLLVGVSGGPDSVCLLHILLQLKDRLGIELHVAHLNHLLRGAESDADADYVSQLAQRFGVPVVLERQNVRAYRARRRCSLEEAARGIRYAFFAEICQTIGAGTVAVGHTADDQVETVLMHLLRGSGLSGLRGMQPVSLWRAENGFQLRVLRPLLETGREETEAYCADQGLEPRWDSSNRSPVHLRNRIRSELIPLLQGYNPNIKAALLRIARSAQADHQFLQQELSQVWDSIAIEEQSGIALDNKGFSSLHPSLKRHLLRATLERVLGSLDDISSAHIENLMKAMAKPAGKRLSLPGDLSFSGDYQRSLLAREEARCPLSALVGKHKLNIPGQTALPGWHVQARILEHQPEADTEHSFQAYLDLDVAGDNLFVRGRRPGDRFQPLGLAQPKKLQDFMVDAKIPRTWRDRVPLVCSPEQILWVVGWRIDHRAQVSPQTKRVLSLEFEKPALVQIDG